MNFFDPLQMLAIIFVYVYLSQKLVVLSQALLCLPLLPVQLYYLNKGKNNNKKQNKTYSL